MDLACILYPSLPIDGTNTMQNEHALAFAHSGNFSENYPPGLIPFGVR